MARLVYSFLRYYNGDLLDELRKLNAWENEIGFGTSIAP